MFSRLVCCISLFFIFGIILYTQILSSKYDCIFHDDFFTMFNYNKGFINEYFINSYHGRFITNSIATLIGSIIPLHLNIHPSEWITSGGCVFKSIFIFIVCYLIASTIFLFDNKRYTEKNILIKFLLISIFTFLIYFFYQNFFKCSFQGMLYMSFYGFTFPFIFYFLFWNKFLIFIDCENNSKKNIFIISLLSFLTGYSTEFCAFSTFVSFSFVLAFLVLSKYKHLKHIAIFYMFNLFGFLLYTLLPGFQNEAKYGKILIFNSFYKNFDSWFIEVIQGLKDVFVPHLLGYFILATCLFYFAYFLKRKDKSNKNILIFFILMGGILFYILMFFSRMKGGEGYLFFIHYDILVQMKFFLLYIIALLTSLFISQNKIFYTILLCFISFCSIYEKENLCSLYKLLSTGNKKEYIGIYSNQGVSDKRNKFILEYIALDLYKNSKLQSFIDNNSVYMFPYVSVSYIETIYNLSYKFDDSSLNVSFENEVEFVENSYNKFINEYGGIPLTEDEIEKCDFNMLLHRYRE